MAKNPRAKNVGKWVGTNLCRLLLSATFLFSGMVKLIDPKGTQYKIEDYLTYFDVPLLYAPASTLTTAVVLALLEFYLGFNLLFGIRRKLTTRLCLMLLLVLTPVTLILAVREAHMDCGCFGDAVHLTNWQTFGKNVLLLMAATVVCWAHRHMTPLVMKGYQWLLSVYALLFAFTLALYNIHYLPLIDFRPYHIGVDLPKAIQAEWETPSEDMRYADFSIISQEGEDMTFEWLGQQGYKFLLVAPDLEHADDGTIDQVNSLYDYSQQQGYPFLALTASLPESINRWRDLTGAEYVFASTDGTVLKTMIRSNPGLFLLHDGIIYQKWSCNDLPELGVDSPVLEQTSIGGMGDPSQVKELRRLLLWLLVPLLAWTLIDRLWVGRSYYRKYKKRIEELKN